VELRMIDGAGVSTRLPPASTVRQQVDHWIRTGMPVLEGCIIKSPAGLSLDAVVVRTVPAKTLVTCEFMTRVSFDDRSDEELIQAAEIEATSTKAEQVTAGSIQDSSAHLLEATKTQKTITNSYAQQGTSLIQEKSLTAVPEMGPSRTLYELVVLPVAHYRLAKHLGDLHSPRGILLHGPSGTGKSRAAYEVVDSLQQLAPCKLIIFDPQAGDSPEEGLRDAFAQAESFVKLKSSRARAVILVDNIDTVCPVRSQEKGADDGSARTVAQLLTLMDGLHEADRRILVLGTTSRPNDIDGALRRPGRFEREVAFAPPTLAERTNLLQKLAPSVGIDTLQDIARTCVGFTAGDLDLVVTQARLHNMQRNKYHVDSISPSLATPSTQDLELEDFEEALRVVGRAGSLLRSAAHQPVGEITIRGEVAGYAPVKLELTKALDWPVLRADAMRRLNLRPPRGILMHGPPGCSKTTLARSVAAKSGHAFFTLSGADVYSPFVGDAERTVREVFAKARLALPAVVFLDEIDALVGKRGMTQGEGDEASSVQSRVLSTLLNEMDGLVAAHGLLVLAATNRVDMVDAALLRPGRFDRVINVPLPDAHDKRLILAEHLRRIPLKLTLNSDHDLVDQNIDDSVPTQIFTVPNPANQDSHPQKLQDTNTSSTYLSADSTPDSSVTRNQSSFVSAVASEAALDPALESAREALLDRVASHMADLPLSGAQIENICREAAVLAVRRGLDAVGEDCLVTALDACRPRTN